MKTVTSSIFLAFIFSLNISLGQETESVIADSTEKEATFPGGTHLIYRFIVENMEYPEEAEKNGEEGRVFVEFTIEKTGEITNVEVIKGVSPSLDKEAIRIVSSFPNWEPAEKNGKAVKARGRMPISFRLP
jgi:protein TonB